MWPGPRPLSDRLLFSFGSLAEQVWIDNGLTRPFDIVSGSWTFKPGASPPTTIFGTGASPKATDTVTVHYRGTLENGKEFDSSYARNAPASFPLSQVIPCWTEGVQKLKVGGKAKLVCPPKTAYGERGAAGVIPPNSTLNFEVELISIGKQAQSTETPGGAKRLARTKSDSLLDLIKCDGKAPQVVDAHEKPGSRTT